MPKTNVDSRQSKMASFSTTKTVGRLGFDQNRREGQPPTRHGRTIWKKRERRRINRKKEHSVVFLNSFYYKKTVEKEKRKWRRRIEKEKKKKKKKKTRAEESHDKRKRKMENEKMYTFFLEKETISFIDIIK